MDNDTTTREDGAPSWVGRGVSVVFDDTEGGLLPVGEVLLQIAALTAGPEAITLLHDLAGRSMSEEEQLQVIALWQPQLAWVAGAEQGALLAYAGPTPDPRDDRAVLADEFAPSNLAPVLNSTTDHAQDRVWKARQLAEKFTDLGDLLRAGALDAYRVHLIVEVLSTLGPDQVAQVQAGILPVAATLSPAQLRKELRTLARAVDPLWNTKMFTEARKTRRVNFDPQGQDGLVGMHAYLPPVEAMAVQQHLEQAAQTGPVDENDQRGHDQRGHDERMADALIGAVLGTAPGDPSTPLSPHVLVNVFVPLPLLTGLQRQLTSTEQGTGEAGTGEGDGVGWIEGYGAYPSELIRLLATDAAWRRWVLEPVTGHLLDLGKERYRPSPELSEYTRARDRYCRYPGCTRKAIGCDLDHLHPFCHHHPDQGGSTSSANLAAECRRHHRGKTLGILNVTGNPNGALTWTDQHGQTGTTEPHNYNNGL